MIFYTYLIFIIFLILFINNLLIKKQVLLNLTGESHQSFTSKKKVPLTGGIFLILSFLLLFHEVSIINKLIILVFYLIGFFSDIKFLKSPINFR